MTPQDPHALVKEVRDGLAEREGWALELVDYSDYDPVPNAPKLRALELIARHLTEARITDQGGEGNVAEFCCADDARAVLKSRVDLTRLCAALESVTEERDEEIENRDAAQQQCDGLAHVVCEVGGWSSEHSSTGSPAQDAVEALAALVGQRDQARADRRAMAESLTKANERADRLTSAADRMAGALQDRKGCSSCPLGGDDCDGCAVLAWRETRGDG